MTRASGLALLSALLVLAGCQQAGEDAGAAQGLAEMPENPLPSAASVLLKADGLEVTGAEGTYLAFDSPRETVERELARVLGPIVERSRNVECGAGPVDSTSFPGGLTVNFQQSRLEGWYLGTGAEGEAGADISVGQEITLGSSERELAAAFSMERVESTLGDEFVTDDGISGLLAGREGARTVDALYSGTTCFFR